MIYQIVETFNNNIIVVADNKLIKNPEPEQLSHTWSDNYFKLSEKTNYAFLYAQQENITDICPSFLSEEWKNIRDQLVCLDRMITTAKIDRTSCSILDLYPEQFLIQYYSMKNRITEYVFNKFDRPKNYNLLIHLYNLVKQIESSSLNIDLNELDSFNDARTEAVKLRLRDKKYIRYNIFGTITGRMTTKHSSFPILTLDKKYRKIIKPKNDYFIEFDFNGADLRSFLGLANLKQPEDDIHEFHAELYNQEHNKNINREEMKKKFISWFYNLSRGPFDCQLIDQMYNREKILNNFWDGKYIHTPFGRVIESDNVRKLNTLVQSVSTDLFYESILSLNNFLKQNKFKTFISFSIHDSVVLDIPKDELKHLDELKDIMGKTRYGQFLINLKIGKNYGEMKKIKICKTLSA